VTLLRGVLDKTGDLLAGVRDDQWHLATPCPEFDVRALSDHLVGWISYFDARCHDREFDGDPASYRSGDDPAAEFRAVAQNLVAGWDELGIERRVGAPGAQRPAETLFNITVTEYLAHGWDLAVATGQPVPFTDAESADVLVRAQGTLDPQYRGVGMPFGDIVEVDDGATATSRVVAFLGRHPTTGR